MTARTWSALLFIAWLAAAPAALAQKVDILALGASNTYGKVFRAANLIPPISNGSCNRAA